MRKETTTLNDTALISVLITAYNREQYIEAAIDSVLKSSYTNFELIIVDDCSTDETPVIAKRYQDLDDRISVFINEKNLGQFANRDRAVSLATGEYIVTVDSDDMIYPFTICYLIESMKEFPEASFGTLCRGLQQNKCVGSAEAIHNHFFVSPVLVQGPGATIFKRSYYHSIGGYTNDYGVPGDMYFNLKAAAGSPVVFISREFMYYRLHEAQEINNSYSYLVHNYRYMRDALIKIDMHLSPEEKLWLEKKNKRRFAVNIIQYSIRERSLKKIRTVLKQTEFSFANFIQGIFHFD